MVVIVITGIVLHPRFVVIGKCMAYKLSLFFYLYYFNIVCKSQKRKNLPIGNTPIIYVSKKTKKLLVLQSYILKCLRH